MLGFLLDGCGLFPHLFPRLGYAALSEVSTRQARPCLAAGRALARAGVVPCPQRRTVAGSVDRVRELALGESAGCWVDLSRLSVWPGAIRLGRRRHPDAGSGSATVAARRRVAVSVAPATT